MKPKAMITVSIILGLSAFVLFCYAMNEETKPKPQERVYVGESYKSADPFMQNHESNVIETVGDWVKYRQTGDKENEFRSTTLAQFRVWFPNKVMKNTDLVYNNTILTKSP